MTVLILRFVMSDWPDISHDNFNFCSGSIPTSYDIHLAVSFIPRAKYCDTPSHLHAISSPTVCDKSLLSSSLLSSSATRLDVCETAVPPESLKDLTCFIFNRLSSCNLHSIAALFSDSVKDIFLPWLALVGFVFGRVSLH